MHTDNAIIHELWLLDITFGTPIKNFDDAPDENEWRDVFEMESIGAYDDLA